MTTITQQLADALRPMSECLRDGITLGIRPGTPQAIAIRDALAAYDAQREPAAIFAALIAESEAAAARLESLARTFSRMTDRHGDGEACEERAYRLREAIARAQGVQS